MATAAAANKQINYTDAITPSIIQALLQGNGGGTTTTQQTSGYDPAILAQIQSMLGGGAAPSMSASATMIPEVSSQITPEQLAAIFSQGAQQVPVLTQAYANASGARSSNNSGLKLALNDLNSELTRQSAVLGQDQQKLSTQAAQYNQSASLQAQQINAQLEAAFAAANAQQQAQLAGILASNGKTSTTTQEAPKSTGVNPYALIAGGMGLNWLNKDGKDGKNRLDSFLDGFGTNTSAPTAAEMPSYNFSDMNWGVPDMATNYFDGGFNNTYDFPSFTQDFSTSFQAPSYDFGNSFSGSAGNDFGLGGWNFGGGNDFSLDWLGGGNDTGASGGGIWDSITSFFGF